MNKHTPDEAITAARDAGDRTKRASTTATTDPAISEASTREPSGDGVETAGPDRPAQAGANETPEQEKIAVANADAWSAPTQPVLVSEDAPAATDQPAPLYNVGSVESDEPEQAYEDAGPELYTRPRGVVQINRALFFVTSAFAAALIIALATATIVLMNRKQPEANPVVATVNGEKILRSEYDAAVAKNNGSDVLDGLVLERLVADEAKKRNIVIGDDEVARLVGEQKQNFGTDQAWQAALAQAGLTEAELAKQLRLSAMLRKMVADKVQITDAELQSTLDQAKDQFAGMDPDAAKQQARDSLQRQKENAAVQDLVAQLKNSATIEKKLPGAV